MGELLSVLARGSALTVRMICHPSQGQRRNRRTTQLRRERGVAPRLALVWGFMIGSLKDTRKLSRKQMEIGDRIDVILGEWEAQLPELDTSPVAVIGRINRLAQLLQERIEPVFLRHGLNGGEYDVLAALRRAGPPFRLSPSALSQSLIVTSGGMTKRLKSLEDDGLVRRSPSRLDRRSTLVQLTPRGRRLVDSVVVAHVANERRLIAALDEDSCQHLASLLRRFLVALGDDAEPRAPAAELGTASAERGGGVTS
jgi:DNA-binding MarR family transcriptional regulator